MSRNRGERRRAGSDAPPLRPASRRAERARRGRGQPVGVGEVLERMIQTTDLGARLEEAKIWERWDTIAGPYLSPHSRPVAVRERVLHIEADSPVWMHKLAFKKWEIIRRINVLARRELVSDVFLRLADDGPEPQTDADAE